MRLSQGSLKRRTGISLLEVLIAIFVLVVGILGLAALIPIGRFEVQEANKLDRGAALGKQAYREMRLRGWLDARNEWLWFDRSNKQFNAVLQPDPATGRLQFTGNWTPPFAIDPQMFADPKNYQAIWGTSPDTPVPDTFPYNVDNDASNVGLSNVPRMARLSLNQFMPTQGTTTYYSGWTEPQQMLSEALCDRSMRGHDDLSFFVPEEKDARPVQQFSIREDSSTTSNDYVTQNYAKRLAPMNAGEFSWMFTVSPTLGESWRGRYTPDTMQSYVVSVVVFHKRPITLMPPDANAPPAERTVALHFAGSGVGGGSVHLESHDPAYLRDLKPNQWILVTGRLRMDPTQQNPANPPAGSDQPPVVAKWYRIVAVDDGSQVTSPPDGELPHRDVTLDGPDWNTQMLPGGGYRFDDLNTSTTNEWEMAAAIFDGVVAVYDKTMQLDLTGR